VLSAAAGTRPPAPVAAAAAGTTAGPEGESVAGGALRVQADTTTKAANVSVLARGRRIDQVERTDVRARVKIGGADCRWVRAMPLGLQH